jgi:hypothetical protein
MHRISLGMIPEVPSRAEAEETEALGSEGDDAEI